jgi:hypothetical protein
MSKLSLLFAIALCVCPMANSLWAQERAAPFDPYARPPKPYPDAARIAFQWNYTCETHGCSFQCHAPAGQEEGPPGLGADSLTGAASRVTKLDIYLGRIPDEPDSHAVYYSFNTEYAKYGTGFTLGGKLTAMTCQVIRMKLDYSGPPKENAPLTSQK